MLLYSKITKYTTLLAVLMVAVFTFHSAKAAPISTVITVPDSPNGLFAIQVSSDNRFVATNSIYDDTNDIYTITFNVPVTYSFIKQSYSSWLYLNGLYSFEMSFLPSFGIPILSSSCSYSYEVSCDDSCYGVLFANNFYRQVSNSTRFAIYFDNTYSENNVSRICSFTVNYMFTASVRDISQVGDLYLTVSDFALSSLQYNISTSVQPSAIHGMAYVISEAVSRSIMNSTLDDDLSGIHTDIEATNLILAQIKQQDQVLYNQIISSIVNQTQHDSILQQAFIDFMSQQLYGEASYTLTPGTVLNVSGPIGDIVSEIWYQVVDFKTKFQAFVIANQSAAASVNSEAASQEQALNDLQESLVVPTPAVENMLDDIAIDFRNEDIAQGQNNAFFWTRYPVIINILVMSVSLGLVGFILYGKG